VNVNREYCSRCWILPVMGLLFLAASGCNSGHPIRGNESSVQHSAGVSNPLEQGFDGGSYCVQTFTQGPPPATPIHFSNKVTESDGSSKDFETDLLGDKLDQTIRQRHPATDEDRKFIQDSKSMVWVIRDGFAEMASTNHYTRADESGWRGGVTSVALGGTPWRLFLNKPTATRVGAENINGYDTIKYAVDTTHQSLVEKAALLSIERLKDYNITGTAWATKDTHCILQYVIDFEEDSKDGKVSKTHYEGAVMKQ
jgi:hypothetical protein